MGQRVALGGGVGGAGLQWHHTCSWSSVTPLQSGVRGLAVRNMLRQCLAPPGHRALDTHLQLAGVLLMLWAVGGVRGVATLGGHPHQEQLAGDWPNLPPSLGGGWSSGPPTLQEGARAYLGWERAEWTAVITAGDLPPCHPTREGRTGPRAQGQLLRGCWDGSGGLSEQVVSACACMCACWYMLGLHLAELCGCHSQAHTGLAPHWLCHSA